jgi:3'-phosphoadenosine 5'-phosphosulfate sulfotransferase (PAPS reductase)/FAD synthetase
MRFDEVIKTYGYPIIGKRQANAISLARKNFEDGVYTLRLALLGMTVEEAKSLGLRLPSSELLERYAKTTDKSKFNLPKYRKMLDVDFKVSDLCCDVMKKEPAHKYEKETGRKAIVATMTDESTLRENNWLHHGCNAFNSKRQQSAPMSFWTEQDVLQYIKKYEIPIASVYGEVEYTNDPDQLRFEDLGIECEGCEELHLTGCHRTGCVFCGFGCHLEESPSRFERLKITHPRQYEYCIGGGEYNEDGIWQPNKQGLGMGHVFEVLNQIYGEGFIKY